MSREPTRTHELPAEAARAEALPTEALPTLADLQAAAERIRGHALHTPVMPGRGGLDAMFGATLFFKCENLQRVGAFKFRGAMNAVQQLSSAQLARGVATHSSGNHAAALALAAQIKQIPAHVVMPEGSARPKVEAVRAYGAQITFCANNQQAREAALDDVLARTGANFIHPYDDWRVVCGAATAALELFAEVGHLDILLTPVGGGGLASGSALASKLSAFKARADGSANTPVRFIAVEPANADDAARSFATGVLQPQRPPNTIADGLRTALSQRTFNVLRTHADAIVTVSEQSIIEAMRLLWSRLNIVVEASAAVPLAALLEQKVQIDGDPRYGGPRYGGPRAGRPRIGIILSGGNVDLNALPWQTP